MDIIRVGIITVSDSCSINKEKNLAGPDLQKQVAEVFPDAEFHEVIVPDEKDQIKDTLAELCDVGCDVIFTTGGTGFSPRDVTPEATKEFISREANGLSYALIAKGLEETDMAMLSRPVCGIKGKTLILNFPGSAKAAVSNFGFVKNALSHAISILRDNKVEVNKHHKIIQNETIPTESKVKLNNVAHRNRVSPYRMVEVEEALTIIFKEASPNLETEVLSYKHALNRVLAEDVFTKEPIPPFRAAIKDGYAAKGADKSTVRKVIKYQAAGDEGREDILQDGEVIRISTGAIVPSNADTVIPVEYTNVQNSSLDGEEIDIKINEMDSTNNIRDIGSDLKVNTLVLEQFERISYSHVGVLASLGKMQVKVYKQPVIGLLSTGNELVEPQGEIELGQIRDSNKYTLTCLLAKYGYRSKDFGITKDEPNVIKRNLQKCFDQCDVVVTTGGMSMSEFDIVKDVLIEDFNALIHFGRVNMKPGKPTAFATLKYNGKLKLYFGLPGNPVSSSVTCILFVIPTLRFLERCNNYRWPSIRVESSLDNRDVRPEYHRVIVTIEPTGRFQLVSTGNQISSRLNSMVKANGLAIVPNILQKTRNIWVLLFDDLICSTPKYLK